MSGELIYGPVAWKPFSADELDNPDEGDFDVTLEAPPPPPPISADDYGAGARSTSERAGDFAKVRGAWEGSSSSSPSAAKVTMQYQPSWNSREILDGASAPAPLARAAVSPNRREGDAYWLARYGARAGVTSPTVVVAAAPGWTPDAWGSANSAAGGGGVGARSPSDPHARDDERTASSPYIPALEVPAASPASTGEETPIEREIRAAWEREDSLRRKRGIAAPGGADEYVEIRTRNILRGGGEAAGNSIPRGPASGARTGGPIGWRPRRHSTDDILDGRRQSAPPGSGGHSGDGGDVFFNDAAAPSSRGPGIGVVHAPPVSLAPAGPPPGPVDATAPTRTRPPVRSMGSLDGVVGRRPNEASSSSSMAASTLERPWSRKSFYEKEEGVGGGYWRVDGGSPVSSPGSPPATPETPIEREIRVGLQREASLRRKRGLSDSGHLPELVEIRPRPGFAAVAAAAAGIPQGASRKKAAAVEKPGKIGGSVTVEIWKPSRKPPGVHAEDEVDEARLHPKHGTWPGTRDGRPSVPAGRILPGSDARPGIYRSLDMAVEWARPPRGGGDARSGSGGGGAAISVGDIRIFKSGRMRMLGAVQRRGSIDSLLQEQQPVQQQQLVQLQPMQQQQPVLQQQVQQQSVQQQQPEAEEETPLERGMRTEREREESFRRDRGLAVKPSGAKVVEIRTKPVLSSGGGMWPARRHGPLSGGVGRPSSTAAAIPTLRPLRSLEGGGERVASTAAAAPASGMLGDGSSDGPDGGDRGGCGPSRRETPIEREIRMNREREDSLRRERGIGERREPELVEIAAWPGLLAPGEGAGSPRRPREVVDETDGALRRPERKGITAAHAGANTSNAGTKPPLVGARASSASTDASTVATKTSSAAGPARGGPGRPAPETKAAREQPLLSSDGNYMEVGGREGSPPAAVGAPRQLPSERVLVVDDKVFVFESIRDKLAFVASLAGKGRGDGGGGCDLSLPSPPGGGGVQSWPLEVVHLRRRDPGRPSLVEQEVEEALRREVEFKEGVRGGYAQMPSAETTQRAVQ